MRGRTGSIGAALVALALVAVTAGCAPAPEAGVDATGGTAARPSGPVETRVLMLGRSVMRGWFDHWGYDGGAPVEKGGYALTYREVEGPEGIARSASEAIGEAPEGSTVFFKFCFVDFSGDDEELERNKGYVETVVDAAEERGVALVIGNALPKTKGETTRELVAEHREYNEWLEGLAAEHAATVRIFDMYGVLAGSDGALKSGYPQGRDDAHLTEAAYDALDEAFFDLLGSD